MIFLLVYIKKNDVWGSYLYIYLFFFCKLSLENPLSGEKNKKKQQTNQEPILFK